MSTNVDFYYFDMSPPSRVAWMIIEELGIPYNEHVVNIIKGEQKTADYQKLNIRQKVPALKDGDLCLGESRAIAAYLVTEYGPQTKKQDLYPSESKGKAVVDQHLYISENIFEQITGYLNIGGVLFRGQVRDETKIEEARKALQFIEDLLTTHTYTASDNLTIADFFYYVAVGLLEASNFSEFGNYPKIAAWREKIRSKSYHKKTFEDPMAKFSGFYQSTLQKNAEKKE